MGVSLTDNIANAVNEQVYTLASAAKTATFNSGYLDWSKYRDLLVFLAVTAVSGTTPTLDVKVQISDDGGTTYYDPPASPTDSDAFQFTQVTAVLAIGVVRRLRNIGRGGRILATIAGTTPSFTMHLSAEGKQH